MENETENIIVLLQKTITQLYTEFCVPNTVWSPSFKKYTGKTESFRRKIQRLSKVQSSLHIKRSYSATTTGNASRPWPGKRMTCKNRTESLRNHEHDEDVES